MKICRDLTLNVSLTVKTSNENSMYTYEKSYFGILSLHAFFIKFNCNLQQCNGNTTEKVSILKGHGHDIGQISTSFFLLLTMLYQCISNNRPKFDISWRGMNQNTQLIILCYICKQGMCHVLFTLVQCTGKNSFLYLLTRFEHKL